MKSLPRRTTAAMSIAFALSACGGGSSGDAGSTPPTLTPTPTPAPTPTPTPTPAPTPTPGPTPTPTPSPTPTPTTPTPAPSSGTVNVSGDGSATAGNDTTYSFAAGTYQYTLNSYVPGAQLVLPTAYANNVSVINPSATDGIIEIQADDGVSNVITIVLTGVPSSMDVQVTSVATFNMVFGANSLN